MAGGGVSSSSAMSGGASAGAATTSGVLKGALRLTSYIGGVSTAAGFATAILSLHTDPIYFISGVSAGVATATAAPSASGAMSGLSAGQAAAVGNMATQDGSVAPSPLTLSVIASFRYPVASSVTSPRLKKGHSGPCSKPVDGSSK